MSENPDVPARCDREIFKDGLGICALDAGRWQAEEWVRKVAQKSGQRVDWHYSGGRANVLYIGDYDRVLAAVKELRGELDGDILRIFGRGEHGLYRMGDLG
jgi:hypothetical protein